jgi:hypothetical protein
MEPTYVTFEQAKLLKEKNWVIPTAQYYFEDGVFIKNSIKDVVGSDYGSDIEYVLDEFKENWNDGWVTKKNGDRCFGCPKNKLYFETCAAPEQWEVIEWVFQKYNYSIEAEMNIPQSGEYDGCYVFNGVIKGSEDYKLKIIFKSKDYPTREKAISAAFDYLLKELV